MSLTVKTGLAAAFVGAALLSLDAGAQTAGKAKTVPPTTMELAAINVRALQSDLMVAALACDR